MAEHTASLSGRDFSQHFRLADLADGSMLLGHAFGEPVILARRGTRVFAVGASCPHYGAPLSEGLLVGETIRCPWHHACFDLKTGGLRSPPALNALATWEVRADGDLLRVTGKRETLPATVRIADERAFVIVGTGAAGAVAAETLRSEGFRGRVILIGEDPSPPYDRPNLSKDYLAGHAPDEWIPLRPEDFYDSQKIELRRGLRVIALNAQGRQLRLADGETLTYDALLLATGSLPVRLSVPGADLPNVHYLRSLADSRKLIDAAKHARHAVVVGTGFIGLEVAAALTERGLRVSVVGKDTLPLEHALGPELATLVKELHAAHGVQFHLQDSPVRISETQVTLASGVVLPADVVVVGIGVIPATELAKAAGIAIDRGIVVDDHLATSAPGVFAAGDVARYPDRLTAERIRVEHWVLAQRHGRAAALNMLGRRQPFSGVPFFWSNHYDVAIRFSGYAAPGASREITGSPQARDCAVAFRKGGRITAIATVGNDRLNLAAEAALEATDHVALERLFH
ncbi:MAG: FAD-dependent oxidoreductase [Gammaproteobacteria bacterium]